MRKSTSRKLRLYNPDDAPATKSATLTPNEEETILLTIQSIELSYHEAIDYLLTGALNRREAAAELDHKAAAASMPLKEKGAKRKPATARSRPGQP